MSGALLSITGVGKSFGSFRALQAIDLDLAPGDRLGIIGPNGSGKTTLINCVAGTVIADEGAIRFAGQDVTRMKAHGRARLGIARSFQIPQPFAGMSVIENLLVPLDYLGHDGDARSRAAEVLASMGLAEKRDEPAEHLTQLELRKLELARALVGRPRLLIADEAMAGLSEAEIDEVLAILAALNESGVAIIMIEHIMHAVMRFSHRIICLDAGRLVAAGSPREVAGNPEVQRVYFGERARR